MHKSIHRRTESQRHLKPLMPPSLSTPPLPVHNASRPSSPPAYLTTFVDILRPRKPRVQATAIALLALFGLSFYLLILSPSLTVTSSSLHQTRNSPSSWKQFALNHAAKYSHLKHSAALNRPQVALNASEELAALTSFMAALPQNVIPPSVDPSQPIDPQLVLDFDTRSPGAQEEVDEIMRDVWHRNPVVIFSKLRSSTSRELKKIVNDMHLRPSPTIFDVDQRDDASVLVPLLFRLTGSSELPILLIGGQPVGDMAEIRALDASGALKSLVVSTGAEIDGARKKTKGRRA